MAMKIITGYTGEKHIAPADDAGFIKGIVGEGEYVLPTGSQFAATIQSNNEVRIADGELVMQGRHARNGSAYESVVIANGSQGMYRNDLIVARYTKDASTSVETISLVAIKGTATSGTAADPNYNTGKIDNGEASDFPLYRVRLNGVTIEAVEQLWTPYVSGGIRKELIWQNASPTSSFASQTVGLDLSDADEVEIEYRWSYAKATTQRERVKVGESTAFKMQGNISSSDSYVRLYQRLATTAVTGISFEDAYSKQTNKTESLGVSNSYCVPTRIYKIKGVL